MIPTTSSGWTLSSPSGSTEEQAGGLAGRGLPGRLSLGVLRHLHNRSYESVLSVNVMPSIVHAALLAVGKKRAILPGSSRSSSRRRARKSPSRSAGRTPKGKVQSAPAQKWIRNIKTKKALDTNWVFAGSMFVTEETTGKQYYQADSGELICVLSLPTAMLDLPMRSYRAMEARLFEAFAEHLPPQGTPTTIRQADPAGQARGRRQTGGKDAAAKDRQQRPRSKPRTTSRGSRWSIRESTPKLGNSRRVPQGRGRSKGVRQVAQGDRESRWAT